MRNYTVYVEDTVYGGKVFVIIPAEDSDSAIEQAKESFRQTHGEDKIDTLHFYVEDFDDDSDEQRMIDAIQSNLNNLRNK